MKSLAIRMIEFYQRFLSPYKGYRCAHAAYYGSLSCSEAVKQIVQREGLWGGRRQIRDRFRACGVAARQLARVNLPRSLFTNLDSDPLALISRKIAL